MGTNTGYFINNSKGTISDLRIEMEYGTQLEYQHLPQKWKKEGVGVALHHREGVDSSSEISFEFNYKEPRNSVSITDDDKIAYPPSNALYLEKWCVSFTDGKGTRFVFYLNHQDIKFFKGAPFYLIFHSDKYAMIHKNNSETKIVFTAGFTRNFQYGFAWKESGIATYEVVDEPVPDERPKRSGGDLPVDAISDAIGDIKYVAFNFVPSGWYPCDGRLLLIRNHFDLFSMLGITYGGDGRTTFALPDLRGRIPVGAGVGLPANQGWGRYLGSFMGWGYEYLGQYDLPKHNHSSDITFDTSKCTVRVPVSLQEGEDSNPNGNYLAQSDGSVYHPEKGTESYLANVESEVLLEAYVPISESRNYNHSYKAFSREQPSLVLNPIICYKGYYPPRS